MSLSSAQIRMAVILGAMAHAASEQGARLTKTRLVKFLYLLDLYSAQHGKRTFTGWPWAFVHYGPYCRESTDAIDTAANLGYLTALSYESNYRDKDFQLYGPGEQLAERDLDEVKASLPLYVSSHLFGAIRKWADDTYGLLDQVYFHTGPMHGALPGQILSFEGERPINPRDFAPIKFEPLSKSKMNRIKAAIKNIVEDSNVAKESGGLYDEEYHKFLEALIEEETPTGIKGTAKLNFHSSDDD